MINKLLCFMWGHTYDAMLLQNFIFEVIGGVAHFNYKSGLTVIKKCKHCGKIK